MRTRKKRPMGKVTRGVTAESCLVRILEGWVPAPAEKHWVRRAPNGHISFRKETMTEQEITLLGEFRGDIT